MRWAVTGAPRSRDAFLAGALTFAAGFFFADFFFAFAAGFFFADFADFFADFFAVFAGFFFTFFLAAMMRGSSRDGGQCRPPPSR